MAFCGHGHEVDVWNITLLGPVPSSLPPGTLVSVDSMRSEGAVVRNNTFDRALGAMRWKSSNSMIVGNTASNEHCGTHGCNGGDIEIS